MVDTVTAHIGLMPGSLPHRDNARHDPRRHFGFDTHFATPIKYPHLVAADNAARLGVQWVDPHLLTTGRLQHIDVAVGRVGTGLVMEAKHLQWVSVAQRIVPTFKSRGVNWQRADGFIFFQLPAVGYLSQPGGIDFYFAGRRF
ncbi:hypothetical protein D3C76_1287440 [compost metagenome]